LSAFELTVIIFGVMLFLMILRAPIAAAMFAAGVVGYVFKAGWLPLGNYLNTLVFARFSNYELSVIPLFILMGSFATQGGISRSLFQVAAGLMSPFKGGLAMASVATCAAFGAICGSSIATAATITSVAYPEMKRHGYSGRLSTGTLAAGGPLGILIPPSVPLVIYAILTEQNIAKLFSAALIPGVVAMLGYIVAIALYVRFVPGHAPEAKVDKKSLDVSALLGVLPILGIFGLVFGGIYGGWFSPTEGAAVGTASTLMFAIAKREMSWVRFMDCFLSTAVATAMIFLIFAGADVMNAALALTQVPSQIAQVVRAWDVAPMVIVVAIVVFYILLGSVMDELSMLLLTIPILFPVVIGLDFGMPKESVAIWFGIVVLMTVSFGLLAPPVGLNVYVVNGMTGDVPIAESYRGVLPFLLSDIVRLALLLAFPSMALWLVQFVG
jgi:C4-dicarboxylate transporter, DctM subunit